MFKIQIRSTSKASNTQISKQKWNPATRRIYNYPGACASGFFFCPLPYGRGYHTMTPAGRAHYVLRCSIPRPPGVQAAGEAKSWRPLGFFFVNSGDGNKTLGMTGGEVESVNLCLR
jgi:hypothetical protein